MVNIVSSSLENDNNTSIKIVNIVGKAIKMISFLRTIYSFMKSCDRIDPMIYSDFGLKRSDIYVC